MCWTAGGCRKSNEGQSHGSRQQVDGNIKGSSKQRYSTAPARKGIRGLHKICHALWGIDMGDYRESDKYIAWE